MADVMSEMEIKKIAETFFPDIADRLKLIYKQVTGSTNTDARELAETSDVNGTLYAVIAEEQTAGRGTRGRSFYSPQGSGIYMSLIIPYDGCRDRLPLVTPAAAVGVCEALCAVGTAVDAESEPSVKWVNDIYLNEKKICGILTESIARDGEAWAVIIGVGINVYSPEGNFPAEISDRAGAAFPEKRQGLRNRLAAEVICRVTDAVCSCDAGEIISRYRSRCRTIGSTVEAVINGRSEHCIAEDITDCCHLVLRRADGSTFTVLSSAQISHYS